ncbi:MAG: hypothetical protein GNW80_02130 [Asgard group archaeon]|nr:hypothetical protein [Asgard group archaeon]
MTPKKKKSSQTRKRRYGTWFLVGQVLIIVGAALIIAAAIIDIINGLGSPNDYWESYTFGQLNPIVGVVIAFVAAVAILWLAIDKRAYYGLNLYLYAVIIIILACLAGNVGALVCMIGALVIIFYRISRD